MWAFASCCGLRGGSRKDAARNESSRPTERTPLLDADDLPFVPETPARVVDDAALARYQARIDKIIEEASEKIVSINSASNSVPPSGHRHAASASDHSGGSTSTSSRHASKDSKHRDGDADHSRDMDMDTLWRAEKKEKRADGSVYSMKKVQASKGGKKGKSRASDGEADAARTRLGGTAEEVETEHAEENAAAADDEDRYGTVASYRTAAEADAEDGLSDVDEQKGNGALSPEDEDDSGHETPTGPAISGRKRVQDIWPSSPGGEARRGRKQPSKAQTDLDKTLSLSHKDFARLLTEG